MTTPWNLFLDDLRNIKTVYEKEDQAYYQGPWVLCRNNEEAFAEIEKRGMPTFMSLDHDLGVVDGKVQTTMEFVKELADKYPDAKFEYMIHSANPVGVLNLQSFLNSFFRFQEL